jgi:hypothetical protein
VDERDPKGQKHEGHGRADHRGHDYGTHDESAGRNSLAALAIDED